MLTLVIPNDLENKYLQVEYVSKGKEKYYIGKKRTNIYLSHDFKFWTLNLHSVYLQIFWLVQILMHCQIKVIFFLSGYVLFTFLLAHLNQFKG